MTEPKPLATARDLWNATDQLTNPTSNRLRRDDGRIEHHKLPSLLDQLIEAVANGAGQKTGSAFGSRPPLDAGALALLIEIATYIRDACLDRGIKRKRDNRLDLRTLVSAVNSDGDEVRIDACTVKIRGWCARIKTAISNDPDRTWRMHGAACTVCSSTQIPAWDEDGNLTHQPCMIVHSDDGRIDKIVCDFCGTTLTGPDLVEIVRDTRAAISRETA